MQNHHVPETFFHRLAEAAAEAALPHFRQETAIANKQTAGFDPVTAGDREAESAMRALIAEHYPDHGIIGEEEGTTLADAAHLWVLDPIDGTRAFISGIPLWSTLIGLKRDGVPIAGMMSQPFIGERYYGDTSTAHYAGPGGPYTLKTRDCRTLGDALICTTSPALFSDAERDRYDRIEAGARLARYGTDSYGYCRVAAGQMDAVIESGLQPYDIVALIPIVQGAGGVITSWTGGSAAEGGQVLASANPHLHEQLLGLLA